MRRQDAIEWFKPDENCFQRQLKIEKITPDSALNGVFPWIKAR
ncbi:hypothetical protein JM48_0508 [Lactiplantibacillus plantarum]|nr:hypothetical protein JM48_0508 [Lactiplantibacillus plantarum]